MKPFLLVAVLLLAGCKSGSGIPSQGADASRETRSWRQGCFEVDARPMEDRDRGAAGGADTSGESSLLFQVMVRANASCADGGGQGNPDVVVDFARNKEEVDPRVILFDFGLQTNFWLKTPEGRLHPSLYHMERTYGMDQGRLFLLKFRIDRDFKARLQERVPLELYFEVPIRGAGVASLAWQPHQLLGYL